MNDTPLFNDGNKKLIELIFAIHLNVATDPIEEKEFRYFIRGVRKSHKKYFGQSNTFFSKEGPIGRITSIDNKRQITVTPTLLQYSEKKRFEKEKFNDICSALYRFYMEVKKVELEDIKLIGKVYTFQFKLNQTGVELLKSKTGLLKDQNLSFFYIRTNIIDDDKNIHLHVTGEEENIITIKLDVNNADQISGMQNSSFDGIIKFVDEYAKERLIGVLNKNFG